MRLGAWRRRRDVALSGDRVPGGRESLAGKTFILGVGAQKAGTTWLRHYLFGHDQVLMSRLGELHFFDALWREDFRKQCNSDFILRLKLLAGSLSPDAATFTDNEMYRLRALIDRLDMIEGGLDAYAAFFTNRLMASHTHFGDITPSYAVLPTEAFRQIKAFHPQTKVVFLMRDPVERLSSALRMFEGAAEVSSKDRRIGEILSSPAFIERCQYEMTIERLRAVFDPEALFFGFYETLFCDTSIRSLCDFLALPFKPGTYDERVNEGTQTTSLSAADADAARAVLAPTYAYCRSSFGAAVPAAWRA